MRWTYILFKIRALSSAVECPNVPKMIGYNGGTHPYDDGFIPSIIRLPSMNIQCNDRLVVEHHNSQ